MPAPEFVNAVIFLILAHSTGEAVIIPFVERPPLTAVGKQHELSGRLLAPDGVFVFEVSYLVDVVEKTLFDMIYHEHLDYHSVMPLIGFFSRCGLELIDAVRVDTHGGSLRGVVQRKGGQRRVGPSVARAVAQEQAMGLNKAGTFRTFAAHIETLKTELIGLLRQLKADGKRIAGFGAPAKIPSWTKATSFSLIAASPRSRI